MIKFESVLKNELVNFLSIREISKVKSTYDHDKHILQIFDEYLNEINCSNKNLTEDQIINWIRTLNGKSSTVANKVVLIRAY